MKKSPQVNRPMKGFPSYALTKDATPDQIRDAALRAMRDALTVKWKAPANFLLDKYMTDWSPRFLKYTTDRVFAGMPYTNGLSGIESWLEYYDFETGEMKTDMYTLLYQLGNACFSSAMFAWCTVQPDFIVHGAIETFYCDSVVPVGPYELFRDKWIANEGEYSTTYICEQNGQQTMFESYAAVKGADALSYRRADDDHTIMAAQAPTVVRNADGTIDGEKSFLVLMEQSMGFRPVEEDGQTVYYFGSTDKVKTFNQLWKEQFIPYTLKIFTGEESYTPAVVSVEEVENGEVKNFDDLKKCFLKANYKMVSLVSVIRDEQGTSVEECKHVLLKVPMDRLLAFRFPGKGLANLQNMSSHLEKGKNYTYEVTTRLANGLVFQPIKFAFTFEG